MITKDYYEQHAVCPRCFSRDKALEQGTVGTLLDYDQNRATCDCGWRGIVHELIPKQPEDAVPPGPSDGSERLHAWFELSYANYLTIPRSILQSMQPEWQGRMADLLGELDEVLLRERIVWPEDGQKVTVTLETESGLVVSDDLSNYERGRRRLW